MKKKQINEKMKKEMKFILEVEDFKKDSGVSIETMKNVIKSFKNYLINLDNRELTDYESDNKKWTINSLEKEKKKIIKQNKDIIAGRIMVISENDEMSQLKSTKDIIMTLIDNVNMIVLFEKKIKELEKK